MAINENIKTGYDARLVANELKNAASQLAIGIMMSNGQLDALGAVYVLDQVATDYKNWAEGVSDNEEVHVPLHMQAALDQTGAEVETFLNDNFN